MRSYRCLPHDADGTGNNQGAGYHRLPDSAAAHTTVATVEYDLSSMANRDQVDRVVIRVSESFFGGVGHAGAYQRTHLYGIDLGQSSSQIGANWTTTTDDALGRARFVTQPDGSRREDRYSVTHDTSFGWLTVHDRVDANRHRTQWRSDSLGRLRRVDEIAGDCATSGSYAALYPCGGAFTTNYSVASSTSYSYDLFDRLTQVDDALGNRTTLGYDALGRKQTMTDPDMGSWRYAYDPKGNLVRQTDAKGQRLCFAYDALDRLTSKTSSDGTPSSTYRYDSGTNGIGRRTSMSVAGGASTSWTYDARGRVTSVSQTVVGVTLGYHQTTTRPTR